MTLARLRLEQYQKLAESGAGNKFVYEQASAEVRNPEGQLASTMAAEAQAREKTDARTADGVQDEVASVKAQPDLTAAATIVEQAGQYVEMAKAALRPAINLVGSGCWNWRKHAGA